MDEKYSELTIKLLNKVEKQMYSEDALQTSDKVDELLKIVEEYLRKDSEENDF